MFAILKTGGKQYKVKEGDKLIIEKIAQPVGAKIKFDEILLVSDEEKTIIGAPLVKNAFVEGEILEQKKSPKVIIFKYKAKKRYRKKTGHRQLQTVVRIGKITATTEAQKTGETRKKETGKVESQKKSTIKK